MKIKLPKNPIKLEDARLVKRNIVNVGIKSHQRERIIKLLKWGDSINGFVQEAVDKKLKELKK